MDGCLQAKPSPGVLYCALDVPGSRRDHSIAEDISGCAGCWGLLSAWLELK